MANSLGVDITNLILERYPQCMSGTSDQNPRVCREVATVLGCLMAASLSLETEDTYINRFIAVMEHVNEQARRTRDDAVVMATQPKPTPNA